MAPQNSRDIKSFLGHLSLPSGIVTGGGRNAVFSPSSLWKWAGHAGIPHLRTPYHEEKTGLDVHIVPYRITA